MRRERKFTIAEPLQRPRLGTLLAEAWAMVRTQVTVSAVTVAIIAIAVITTMLTTGRSAANERDVIASIDNESTRTIVISVPDSEGIDSTILHKVRAFDNVEWVSAFGSVFDVRVGSFSGGEPIGIRYGWGDLIPQDGTFQGADEHVWASPLALERAGYSAPAGGFVSDAGKTFAVVGTIDVPSFVADMDPLIVATSADPGSVTRIVVLADSAENVNALANQIVALLDAQDPSRVEVSTSKTLLDVQDIILGQFSQFGRELVVIVVVVAALMLGTILSGLILLRRRDFGRRRALGASRGTIITLILSQLLILGVFGIVAGMGISVGVLYVQGAPIASAQFLGALAIVTLAMVTVAGTIPALIAASRDPLKELRVP